MKVGLSPGDFVLYGDPALPSPKMDAEPLPNFRPISGQTAAIPLHASKMLLGMKVGLSPGDFVLDGNPAPPLNFRPMFIIVIVILLEHCAMHSLYYFVQVHVEVLVFYAFYFLGDQINCSE